MRGALAAVVAGLLMLVVPLGECGSAIGAWAAEPLPMPADAPPALDGAEAADDAAAVAAAQAALASFHAAVSPASSPTTTQSSAASTSKRVTVSAVDAREVQAAQESVDAATAASRSAQRELDRLLAAQESSDDPGQYDGQVAAAREDLDQAVARLDEARRTLAVARSRTKTVVVTTSASPRPVGTPTPASAPAGRAELQAQLAEAKQVQAAHRAQREQVLADWKAGHESQVTKVSAHNSRVRSCAGRSAVPAAGGSGLLVAGVGLLLWRRFGRR